MWGRTTPRYHRLLFGPLLKTLREGLEVHLADEIESAAKRFPESFKVQVLRKLDQARRGMEAGLDMTGVVDALAKRVEEIKKRSGIKDDAAPPTPIKVN
ncbi:MAG: hypothetical protein ACK4WF_05730, partial [Candidatus Brocadiales bacterium]